MFKIEYSKNNYPILLYDSKPLHSRIDPLKEGEVFFKEKRDFLESAEKKALIIVGIGLGYFLYPFYQNQDLLKNISIFVLQTSLKEEEFFEQFALPQIKNHIPLFFFNPLKIAELEKFNQELSQFSYNNISLKINQSIYMLLKDFYKEPCLIIESTIKKKLFNVITDSAFGRRWWHNFIMNYHENKIASYILQDIQKPLLIVGSGYSFYENLSLIKNLYSQGVPIFCVLPVVEILLEQGVTPHFIFMTDGGEANRYYSAISKLNRKHTTLLANFHIYFQIPRFFKGKILFFNDGLELEERLTPFFPYIPSGGSVASSLFLFAASITSEIYHTGFDFRFTNHHPHFPGAPLELAYTHLSDRFNSLESITAKKVYASSLFYNGFPTSMTMNSYREHFNGLVKEQKKAGKKVYSIQDYPLRNEKNQETKDFFTLGKEITDAEKRECLTGLVNQMKKSLQEKDYQNPLLTLILNRSLLKKEDVEAVLQEEIKWIEKYL